MEQAARDKGLKINENQKKIYCARRRIRKLMSQYNCNFRKFEKDDTNNNLGVTITNNLGEEIKLLSIIRKGRKCTKTSTGGLRLTKMFTNKAR